MDGQQLKSHQGKDEKNRKLFLNKKIFVFFGIIILLAGAYLLRRSQIKTPPDPLAFLRNQQYYIENIGMSGLYQPGTIIRTMEAGPGGTARPLIPPIVFQWADECFPEAVPREGPFVMPETSGSSTASLMLGADAVGRLLPAFNLSSSAVADYSLKFENCRLLTIQEADLARNFSEKCIGNIKDALRDGKKVDWFSVIKKAVSVDSFTFEIRWRSGSSVESRMAVQEKVRQVLHNTAGVKSEIAGEHAINTQVALKMEDSKQTVFSGKGNLIIGYFAHPLKPVYEQ